MISSGQRFLFLLIPLLVLAACSSVKSPTDAEPGPKIDSVRQVVREYDSSVEYTMDHLLALKQLRVNDTSWTDKRYSRPNVTQYGLTALRSAPDLFVFLNDLFQPALVEWRRLTRDDLRDESAFLKSLLNTLEHNERRVLEETLSIEEAQRFRLRAIPAMNRLDLVIKEVVDWYEDFMTDDSDQTLDLSKTDELVLLLNGAPALFLDARLRWASAKSDLP